VSNYKIRCGKVMEIEEGIYIVQNAVIEYDDEILTGNTIVIQTKKEKS